MVADGLLALYFPIPARLVLGHRPQLLAEAGLRPRVLCGLARVLRRAGVL